MWKDMDLDNKRDDDSAIGDSANNSAGEESVNSRGKSELSDDISDISLGSHNHLSSKLGIKIPGCLLTDSKDKRDNLNPDEGSVNLRNVNNSGSRSKACNEQSLSRGNRQSSNQSKSNNLQNQLKLLLHEMKDLRELDRDILRKFVSLNDCIEEVRWRLAENEAKFQRKLAEDDADEDFFSSLTDSRLGDWDDEVVTVNNDEVISKQAQDAISVAEIICSSPPKSVNTSINPIPPHLQMKITDNPEPDLTVAKASFASLSNRTNQSSYANPTFSPKNEQRSLKKITDNPVPNLTIAKASLDSLSNRTNQSSYANLSFSPKKEQRSPIRMLQSKISVTPIVEEKPIEINDTRLSSPQSSSSDVWIAREKSKSQIVRRSSSRKENPYSQQANNLDIIRPTRSASVLAKKYNELIEQKNSNTMAKSNRRASEDMPVGRRTQWPILDKQPGNKVFDFKKQRDYQNLIGLSRVRGSRDQFQKVDVKKMSKTFDSSNSHNFTTSNSSSNISSRNAIVRNSSNNWNRYVHRSSTTGTSFRNSNHNNNNSKCTFDEDTFDGFYTLDAQSTHIPTSRSANFLSHDLHAMAVSCQKASPGPIFNWFNRQDNLSTFL